MANLSSKRAAMRMAAAFCASVLLLSACGGAGSDDEDAELSADEERASASAVKRPPCNTQGVFPLYRAKFLPNVVVYPADRNIVVETNGQPQHGSPYFPPGTPGYLPYNGPNPAFFNNGNRIDPTKRLRFVIPACPTRFPQLRPTPLGPIGVSVEGVPFFNQFAGDPATGQIGPLGPAELNSFDQYNGHPDPTNLYHYHKEPLWLTSFLGKSALLGYLLDGYPVYGPQDNGVEVPPWLLDSAHGHSHPTAEYPFGIYHYHITASAPYINGNGFRGVPGYLTVGP
jgi:hypothetical protein